jgi:hypothetical protein
LIGAVSTEPVVRSLWRIYEPLHAVTYVAPQARAAFESAGLRGFWRGYAPVERGWLAQDGRATPAGVAAHRAVEDATDRLAVQP